MFCFYLKCPHPHPVRSDLRTNSGEHSLIHPLHIHPSIHPSIFRLLTGEPNDLLMQFSIFKKIFMKTNQTEEFPSISSRTLVVSLLMLIFTVGFNKVIWLDLRLLLALHQDTYRQLPSQRFLVDNASWQNEWPNDQTSNFHFLSLCTQCHRRAAGRGAV